MQLEAAAVVEYVPGEHVFVVSLVQDWAPTEDVSPIGQLEQVDKPDNAEYKPLGQSSQTVTPAVAEYVPAKHAMHIEEPKTEYFPAMHKTPPAQEAEPAGAMEPLGQSVQVIDPVFSEKYPEAHKEHAAAFFVSEYEPAWQLVQPAVDTAVPAAHTVAVVHALNPATDVKPAAQLRHAVALIVAE